MSGGGDRGWEKGRDERLDVSTSDLVDTRTAAGVLELVETTRPPIPREDVMGLIRRGRDRGTLPPAEVEKLAHAGYDVTGDRAA